MNLIAEDIRNNIDIVDVVGRYVSLKKSGANFVGLSPFRQEKTPSFVVSPQKQIFKDFGGDSLGGDVITFVMEIENIDFMDAIRILAKDAGIDLSKYDTVHINKKHEQIKEKIKKISKRAQTFFHKKLMDSEKALVYLYKKRKLSDDTISKFQLGYSPDSYYDLLQFLKKEGFSEEELLQGSLAKRGHGGESFSFFRDRLMIPIFDKMGNTIGFGGRALENETQPKYINTTDTVVYDKSKVLYGINWLRDGVRKNDFSVVVEGYMDVIAWSRMDYDNAVATCGTSLTAHHLKQLKRYSENVYLLFDMDDAGFQATLRALKLAYSQDVYPKVMQLEGEHKDIDDLVNSLEPNQETYDAAVKSLLSSAKDAIHFVLLRLKSQYDLFSPVDKKRFLDELFSLIAYINSPTIQHGYLEMIADDVGLEVNVLISQFKTFKKKNHRLIAREMKEEPKENTYNIELEILVSALCWQGYLEKGFSFEGTDKLLTFFSELVDFLSDDNLLKQSRNKSVEDPAMIQKLNETQLRWDNELERVGEDKQLGTILQKLHTYMKHLPKMRKMPSEEFLRFQSLRKTLFSLQ